jgi:hypothetical protein
MATLARLLTIVGGVREPLVVTRRGRGKTVCARGACPALLGGPSTSPLDAMVRLVAVLGAFAIAGPAVAEDSVVLGHGISNAFLSNLPCTPGSICMDANYVWILDADRTVAGPRITGQVRAISAQHIGATDLFVKSVELFVLRPIHDSALQKVSGAKYSLVSLSPRDSQGRYCLSVAPKDVGLKVEDSEVSVDPSSGYFCFKATALASNNRWRGP